MKKKTLDERLKAERLFHDQKFSSERKSNYYGLGFNDIIFKDMMQKVGNIEGKKVVEFGCGEGWFTKYLAEKGAEIWSFDISEEAIKKNIVQIRERNLEDRVHFDVMSAERLIYESNAFDLVIGIAILHHLDLKRGLKEIRRVLKKGGKAYFMEPLGHNPFLNLYRKMTPSLRSEDETPLRFEHFQIMRDLFSSFKHEEYHLTSIFSLVLYFLGKNQMLFRARDSLLKLDSIILSRFPRMKKYCWYSILELEK